MRWQWEDLEPTDDYPIAEYSIAIRDVRYLRRMLDVIALANPATAIDVALELAGVVGALIGGQLEDDGPITRIGPALAPRRLPIGARSCLGYLQRNAAWSAEAGSRRSLQWAPTPRDESLRGGKLPGTVGGMHATSLRVLEQRGLIVIDRSDLLYWRIEITRAGEIWPDRNDRSDSDGAEPPASGGRKDDGPEDA